ncbi:hypothetical protein Tco_1157818 [Tanacetum coccineum]
MAYDSICEVIHEGATVGKNVRNKRKRGSDHGRNSDQQQNRRIRVVRAHATGQATGKRMLGNYLTATSELIPFNWIRIKEIRDSQLTSPETVNETIKTKKSYAEVRRKPVEFQVGVKGMMKMSPERGDTFWQTGKAKPELYFGPFKNPRQDPEPF